MEIYRNPPQILLIGKVEESLWFSNLTKALTSLGEFQVVPEKDIMQYMLRNNYDMVVVDASTINNEYLLISRIKAQLPVARIVVITAAPTWRRAREVLQAGAVDYITKYLSEGEYISILKTALVDCLA